jgi:ABC-type multidrug transport system ATPase subunit
VNEPVSGIGLAARRDVLADRPGTAPAKERATSPEAAAPLAGSDGLLLRGVCKRWHSQKPPSSVLRDVDLELARGTIGWVGGINGAGKTTLLRVIAGVLAPDAGRVGYRGLDPERRRRDYQRRVGFVSAGDRGLYARLSVRRHLDYCARIAFVPRSERAAVKQHAVERFGLAELLDRRVERLSLGQRQRVRLALAFLHGPELALLDEPASSLDDDGVGLLRAELARIISRGGVVVWCSPPGERSTIDSDVELTLRDGTLVSS